MHNQKIKNEVLRLRSYGVTFSEIQRKLPIEVSKSTLSMWCKNIALPAWYSKRVDKLIKNGLKKAQAYSLAQHIKKRNIYLKETKDEARKIFKDFHISSIKIALAMLYLGEGAKLKGHSGLMLGSSDPILIQLYVRMLKKCYDINPKDLKCRISYRADQNLKELEQYWSQITRIPLINFYKTKFDPRTIGKKTLNKNYKGVCVITCAGAKIQLELETFSKLLLRKLRGS